MTKISPAVPVWARKALEATGRVSLRRPGGRFIKDTTGLTLKLRRAVCRACNNGWMSQTEKLVAPLLAPATRGELTAFAKPQTDLIAFWAVKTTLLMELANRVLRPLLEVHLFDFSDDIYGAHLNVRFLHKLRNETKFPDFEALKAQIANDVESAKHYFKH